MVVVSHRVQTDSSQKETDMLHIMTQDEVDAYIASHGHPVPGPHPPEHCYECEVRRLKEELRSAYEMVERLKEHLLEPDGRCWIHGEHCEVITQEVK